jgi:predicted SAM-dependent methyltransferase
MFINIDIVPLPHIHYVRYIDDLSPFGDNSVNLIYACHCLEHFSHARLSAVLSEWHRVLKEDGILRLSVPDFDLLLDVYHENGGDINTIIQPVMGGQGNKYDFHKSLFNGSSLRVLLKDVGFRDAQEWHPGSSELTNFDDWSAKPMVLNGTDYPLSLNIEAKK